ncbi:MAG: carboxypeptidase-like regulatory domain-containing protein, partial [Saprospirales bacterium]
MRCTLVFFILLFSGIVNSQTSFPAIGGEVIDRDSRQPLVGATISLTADDYFNGTVTDERGRFEVKNVPPGRYRIEVSYLGYETESLSNVLHTSARTLSLDLSLRRTSVVADEVVVRPIKTDSDPGNEFALLSARSFSVEETQRYAASVNDPGRLAVGFPG